MTENEKKLINTPGIINGNITINNAIQMMCDALDELEQYRAIGTVEEFKALTDKGVPIIHGKAELELHDKQIRADAIAELKQRFRNEYEDAEAMEMEDCINWADWLDATAEQILAEMKKG